MYEDEDCERGRRLIGNTSLKENRLNFSALYRDQLSTAILESTKLGFVRPAIISPHAHVSDDVLMEMSHFVNQLSSFFDFILPGYWGNSCQVLSAQIFAHLNARGIPANIVLGNVIINGTDEFETTLETLQQEVRSTRPLEGDQNVHAWISLGDDTVIDAALPPRLVKHYNAPQAFENKIFIGRAAVMVEVYKVQYIPILMGTEFFAKTNPPDPMNLLEALLRR